MWILESTSHPEVNAHSILGDHKYVVGRQNCDIIVADPSVSRRQAVLTMAHYEINVAKSFVIPTLTLEDVSKFGTFVNGAVVKTAAGNTVTLKDNDQIKFGGTPASIYKAKYRPFLATTSCLEKGPKKALQRVMCLLGGHLVRDWRPTCDLLIMSKINVTLKVICAINNQKHIVTPKYLDDLYEYHMGRSEKPDPVQYLPEVVDQEVPPGVSFLPDKRRQTLLQGLKFYFLSPFQFNKTNLAVSTAGGQPILLEDGTEEDAEAMTQEGTVVVLVTKDVMGTLSHTSFKFVRTVMATLKKKNLRTITDPEIGTAILTCNRVDYCNPRVPLAPNLQAAMASQLASQMTDVENSQQVPQSSSQQPMQDVKPEFRSMPLSLAADRFREPRNVETEPQPIKLEKISQESNKTTAERKTSKDAAGATVAYHLSGFARPASKTADANLSSDLEKTQVMSSKERKDSTESLIMNQARTGTKAKASDNSTLDKIPSSLSSSRLSGDLFSDPAVADTSADCLSTSTTGVGLRPDPENTEEENGGLSVFARQRNKKRGISVFNNTMPPDDTGAAADVVDDGGLKKGAVKKRKLRSLFDEDEDDEDAHKSSTSRYSTSSGATNRKSLFDDDEDEDMSAGHAGSKVFPSTNEICARLKTAGDAGKHQETDVTLQEMGQNPNKDDLSTARDNRTAHKDTTSERAHLSKFPGGSPFISTADTRQERSVSAGQRGSDFTGELDVTAADAVNPGEDLKFSSPSSPVESRVGWVNVAAQKTRLRSKAADETSEENEDDKDAIDIKPDPELLRDDSGNLLRNLCEVEVTELVVRQPGQRSNVPCQGQGGVSTSGGQRNFKRFKKTEHAGSGKLPTIIGGRDLEEHRTSAHKDLEDLFTKGIARQNEREEEERRNRDLFDWDNKSRKTSNKMIR